MSDILQFGRVSDVVKKVIGVRHYLKYLAHPFIRHKPF